MESTATAGEILLSRDTAAALPSRCSGSRRAKASCCGAVRRPCRSSATTSRSRSPRSTSRRRSRSALREHLVSGATEPEHRHATVAFVHFDGVDDLDGDPGRGRPGRRPARADLRACSAPRTTTASRSWARTSITTAARSSSWPVRRTRSATTRAGCCSRFARSPTRRRRVPVRIGVNKGHVFAGDIGPGYRRTYTVMGDAVNLAARVMSMAVPGRSSRPGRSWMRSSVAFNDRRARAVHGQGQEGPGRTRSWSGTRPGASRRPCLGSSRWSVATRRWTRTGARCSSSGAGGARCSSSSGTRGWARRGC